MPRGTLSRPILLEQATLICTKRQESPLAVGGPWVCPSHSSAARTAHGPGSSPRPAGWASESRHSRSRRGQQTRLWQPQKRLQVAVGSSCGCPPVPPTIQGNPNAPAQVSGGEAACAQGCSVNPWASPPTGCTDSLSLCSGARCAPCHRWTADRFTTPMRGKASASFCLSVPSEFQPLS